jgi:microcystin-dependent protein
MGTPFIAEIKIWANTYAPVGWAYCDGQMLSPAQNSSLFALLGNTFGGNGHTTFGIPNLKGRAAMGTGAGPHLTPRRLGESYGEPTVALNHTEIPQHDHNIYANLEPAKNQSPSNTMMYAVAKEDKYVVYPYHTPDNNMVQMAPQTLASAGESQEHENRQPFLGITFCIALDGIFPPRS